MTTNEFNNGYYMINGQGVFRYVKGTSYTERTDFNIPNDIPEEERLPVMQGWIIKYLHDNQL